MDKQTEKIGLQTESWSKKRNPAIEYCRLIASVFIVCAHHKFPGSFGEIENCLARFTVPFFFVVSGYFAYRADENDIKKRIIGIFKLNIYSTLLYLLWGSYQEKYFFHGSRMVWLSGALSPARLSQWFIYCINPFAGHLWYLTAIFITYIVIYIYVRWVGKSYNYHSLYIVGVLLYAVHFLVGSLAVVSDFDVPRMLYRNAWFYGIPMFSLGLFIREYKDRIIETYNLSLKKLVLIIVFGAVLSVLQWKGMGTVEMPIGALFEVIALMLLLVSIPADAHGNKVNSFVASKLGKLSTYIYVTHLFWMDINGIYIEDRLSTFGERTSEYLSPILTVLLTVCTGVMWMLMKEMAGKCLKWLSARIRNRGNG